MTRFAFSQVDVFTEQPLFGNALAVVHGADAFDEERMQRFARWTNLSETTFLLAPTDPGADYRVRIFTPGGELPFAGHPTIGSCHAWLEQGGVSRTAGMVVQQCGVGQVRIRLEAGRTAFAAPALRSGAVEPALLERIVEALGLPRHSIRATQSLDNGPTWIGLLLDSADTVLGLEPDHAAMRSLPKVGVIAPQMAGGDSDFEVRAFAAAAGIAEDPVTGSLNAGLAQWLIGAGLAPDRYVAAQGARLGRQGRVHIAKEEATVWVGGSSITCIRGEVDL
jgi:PhzF family phenazine biosynthesis protein